FLDDAQLPQGRSYVSRVKIAQGRDGEQWLTVPIQKGTKPIREVAFADEPWAERHLRTLQSVYAKAPHATEVLEVVTPLYAESGTSLADCNIRLITGLA